MHGVLTVIHSVFTKRLCYRNANDSLIISPVKLSNLTAGRGTFMGNNIDTSLMLFKLMITAEFLLVVEVLLTHSRLLSLHIVNKLIFICRECINYKFHSICTVYVFI